MDSTQAGTRPLPSRFAEITVTETISGAATGGGFAVPVWARVVRKYYEDHPVPDPWERPEGVVIREISSWTGTLVTESCPYAGSLVPDYFLASRIPDPSCEPPDLVEAFADLWASGGGFGDWLARVRLVPLSMRLKKTSSRMPANSGGTRRLREVASADTPLGLGTSSLIQRGSLTIWTSFLAATQLAGTCLLVDLGANALIGEDLEQ